MSMKPYSAADHCAALAMVRKGWPRTAIADVVGCEVRTITRWAKARGIRPVGHGGRVSEMPAKTARKMARAHLRGESLRAIGRRHGVHANTVLRAIGRVT